MITEQHRYTVGISLFQVAVLAFPHRPTSPYQSPIQLSRGLYGGMMVRHQTAVYLGFQGNPLTASLLLWRWSVPTMAAERYRSASVPLSYAKRRGSNHGLMWQTDDEAVPAR